MHHVDSPCIESIVFETVWNFLSSLDSREPPEAPDPAAISGGASAAYDHHHRASL